MLHVILYKCCLLLFSETGYIEEKELDAFFYHMMRKLGTDVSVCNNNHFFICLLVELKHSILCGFVPFSPV